MPARSVARSSAQPRTWRLTYACTRAPSRTSATSARPASPSSSTSSYTIASTITSAPLPARAAASPTSALLDFAPTGRQAWPASPVRPIWRSTRSGQRLKLEWWEALEVTVSPHPLFDKNLNHFDINDEKNLFLLVQCFPNTGPRTISGPPKYLNWSVGNFFWIETMLKYSSDYHFDGQICAIMVRHTILWSASINSDFYGPRPEKVWETLS